jgi:CheY-like chemotaxis protein
VRAEASEDEAPWLPYLVAVPLPGAALLAIVVYAWSDWDVLAVAALVAGGAFVAGGLLGFLFGIPRSLARPEGEDEAAGTYSPNTNLEQISDWLTKILVGVGLVQFTTLAGHARELVEFLGPALGGDPLGETFAAAILVVFGVSGFLTFYLVTRIYLPRAFAAGDRRARDLEAYRRVRDEKAAEELRLASPGGGTRIGATPAEDTKIDTTVRRAGALAETSGPARILWVDDRPENNTREVNAMTTLGMHVMTCLSTDEALERLARSDFDVVISDMSRPPDREAAYTLLRAMRDAGHTTPFIIYAGAVSQEHRQEAEQLGALGITNRPQELLDLVLQAVEARR